VLMASPSPPCTAWIFEHVPFTGGRTVSNWQGRPWASRGLFFRGYRQHPPPDAFLARIEQHRQVQPSRPVRLFVEFHRPIANANWTGLDVVEWRASRLCQQACHCVFSINLRRPRDYTLSWVQHVGNRVLIWLPDKQGGIPRRREAKDDALVRAYHGASKAALEAIVTDPLSKALVAQCSSSYLPKSTTSLLERARGCLVGPVSTCPTRVPRGATCLRRTHPRVDILYAERQSPL
jgi:hypothetical protein